MLTEKHKVRVLRTLVHTSFISELTSALKVSKVLLIKKLLLAVNTVVPYPPPLFCKAFCNFKHLELVNLFLSVYLKSANIKRLYKTQWGRLPGYVFCFIMCS